MFNAVVIRDEAVGIDLYLAQGVMKNKENISAVRRNNKAAIFN